MKSIREWQARKILHSIGVSWSGWLVRRHELTIFCLQFTFCLHSADKNFPTLILITRIMVLTVKAIGGVRGQKNKLSLSERSHWCGFSAFYGMKKSLSVPKILTIQFFGPLSFL